MSIAVCALAKWENPYIDEWVRYHIDLGFDRVFLYDNNDPDDPYVGDCIDEGYRDRVEIIDRRGVNMRTRQQVAYNDWISQHWNDFDFCAFIDIDEFIVTPNGIRGLVSGMPENRDFMILNWQMYGDDETIVGDETKPVRERFTVKQGGRNNEWNKSVKTIVRCGGKPVKALNAHGFVYADGETAFYCDCNGEDVSLKLNNKFSTRPFENHESYIAHYATKSLSEYLKYKVGRIGVVWNSDSMKIRYYFRLNKRTPEKLEYIERWKETGVI